MVLYAWAKMAENMGLQIIGDYSMSKKDAMNKDGKKLKICPFCKSDKIQTRGYQQYDGYQGEGYDYYVQCRNCHAQSGEFDTIEQAIRAWNQRLKD